VWPSTPYATVEAMCRSSRRPARGKTEAAASQPVADLLAAGVAADAIVAFTFTAG
jgi:hypothetical protein